MALVTAYTSDVQSIRDRIVALVDKANACQCGDEEEMILVVGWIDEAVPRYASLEGDQGPIWQDHVTKFNEFRDSLGSRDFAYLIFDVFNDSAFQGNYIKPATAVFPQGVTSVKVPRNPTNPQTFIGPVSSVIGDKTPSIARFTIDASGSMGPNTIHPAYCEFRNWFVEQYPAADVREYLLPNEDWLMWLPGLIEGECPDCNDAIPAILNTSFEGGAGVMMRDSGKVQELSAAILWLLDHEVFRRHAAYINFECDSNVDYWGAACKIMTAAGVDLDVVSFGTFDANEWINQVDTLLTYLEGLFVEGVACPEALCPPQTETLPVVDCNRYWCRKEWNFRCSNNSWSLLSSDASCVNMIIDSEAGWNEIRSSRWKYVSYTYHGEGEAGLTACEADCDIGEETPGNPPAPCAEDNDDGDDEDDGGGTDPTDPDRGPCYCVKTWKYECKNPAGATNPDERKWVYDGATSPVRMRTVPIEGQQGNIYTYVRSYQLGGRWRTSRCDGQACRDIWGAFKPGPPPAASCPDVGEQSCWFSVYYHCDEYGNFIVSNYLPHGVNKPESLNEGWNEVREHCEYRWLGRCNPPGEPGGNNGCQYTGCRYPTAADFAEVFDCTECFYCVYQWNYVCEVTESGTQWVKTSGPVLVSPAPRRGSRPENIRAQAFDCDKLRIQEAVVWTPGSGCVEPSDPEDLEQYGKCNEIDCPFTCKLTLEYTCNSEGEWVPGTPQWETVQFESSSERWDEGAANEYVKITVVLSCSSEGGWTETSRITGGSLGPASDWVEEECNENSTRIYSCVVGSGLSSVTYVKFFPQEAGKECAETYGTPFEPPEVPERYSCEAVDVNAVELPDIAYSRLSCSCQWRWRLTYIFDCVEGLWQRRDQYNNKTSAVMTNDPPAGCTEQESSDPNIRIMTMVTANQEYEISTGSQAASVWWDNWSTCNVSPAECGYYCRVEIEYECSTSYSVTVDAVSNCPSEAEAVSVALPAGTYRATYASGARSAWKNDSFNGGLSWDNRPASSNVSLPGGSGYYATEAEAEAAAQGLTTTFEWGGGDVLAWDTDSYCPDNRGSKTYTFDSIESTALWVGYFAASEETDCVSDHAATEPNTANPCECSLSWDEVNRTITKVANQEDDSGWHCEGV